MGIVGKALAFVAICLIIFMLKSSYNTRMYIAIGLIVGFGYYALNRKKR